MTDGIIKGTGNSFKIKSIANLEDKCPTYEAFLQALKDGTITIDIIGTDAAGWITQGTLLNKANLLSDSTTTALGLPSSATPNDALRKLYDLLSGYVPTTRKVNGKALSSDITLTAADVSAVPTSRTVNGKALSSNITLSASDVSARANTWTPTAADVGAVPTSRTVNGKALSSDITLSASDVGALGSSGTATAATKLATARTLDGVSFNGTAAITHYATCSTAAATAAKTASLTSFSLVTGARVAVKFTVTNTAANPTLNINSTGAKAIYYRGAAIDAGYLAADRTYEFIYNGTQYELVGDINTDTTQTSITGNAATATKLQTSRTIRTNLASTSTASFNGTANVTPGVTGTLGVANGGTGATTAAGARTNLGAAPTESPEFTNSISMGRKADTTVGTRSVSVGYFCTASGDYSHAEGQSCIASNIASHAEGRSCTASGLYSHAEGDSCTASGISSHAEGGSCTASGISSHAEGGGCVASYDYSHAEGYYCTASGNVSHAEGCRCTASGLYSHAEGYYTFCDCKYGAHAEGDGSIAAPTDCYIPLLSYSGAVLTVNMLSNVYNPASISNILRRVTAGMKILLWNDNYINKNYSSYEIASVDFTSGAITLTESLPSSNFAVKHAVVPEARASEKYYSAHAEGDGCVATGESSHAEGKGSIAAGTSSHAEGFECTASGLYSHAEGYKCSAGDVYSKYSHAEGNLCRASGEGAHAEGQGCSAYGKYSHAQNYRTGASAQHQTAMGSCNINSTAETDKLIIGKGTSDTAQSNCFRVTHTGVYAAGSYNASGADYAEMFEWSDGNPEAEDRVGLFVTLDGEKIRIAAPDDDYILGIVSGNPSVVGDVHDDQWHGMYLYDIFGRPLWEDVDFPDETVQMPDPEDPEKTITKVIVPAHTEHRQKLNPDYNGDTPYQKRTERKEWDAVGLLGKLVAVDDGTCVVNGYCTVAGGGKATASAQRTKYRVMARIDDTHIRIMIL